MRLSLLILTTVAQIAHGYLENLDIPQKTYSLVKGIDRPDVHQMTDAQFDTYAQTLREFMWRNSGKDYSNFLESHRIRWINHRAFDDANSSPYWFLNELESKLQNINPDVKIPSWDYTKYLGNCVLDPALSASRFGSKLTEKGCLDDGKFIPPSEYNHGCIKRRSLVKGFGSTKSYLDTIVPKTYGVIGEWLTDKSNVFRRYLWNLSDHYMYDPLIFSMQAYHLKVLSDWGKENNVNIDVDSAYSIGNQEIHDTIFKEVETED